ncbi:hypothetical protein [Exiguobacterium sp. NG55]|uniref:hypothetical protein n=1 Tax=Exiguobacterium sp. NG55 TaxID=375477 RepID=UPI0004DFB7E5|nr:hypothetical protein [Exiguobacterium sp. NG55]
MKKLILKKIEIHDKNYEIFKRNIASSQNEKRQDLINKLENNFKTFRNEIDFEDTNEKSSPADLWFEAIKKGRF